MVSHDRYDNSVMTTNCCYTRQYRFPHLGLLRNQRTIPSNHSWCGCTTHASLLRRPASSEFVQRVEAVAGTYCTALVCQNPAGKPQLIHQEITSDSMRSVRCVRFWSANVYVQCKLGSDCGVRARFFSRRGFFSRRDVLFRGCLQDGLHFFGRGEGGLGSQQTDRKEPEGGRDSSCQRY